VIRAEQASGAPQLLLHAAGRYGQNVPEQGGAELIALAA